MSVRCDSFTRPSIVLTKKGLGTRLAIFSTMHMTIIIVIYSVVTIIGSVAGGAVLCIVVLSCCGCMALACEYKKSSSSKGTQQQPQDKDCPPPCPTIALAAPTVSHPATEPQPAEEAL